MDYHVKLTTIIEGTETTIHDYFYLGKIYTVIFNDKKKQAAFMYTD